MIERLFSVLKNAFTKKRTSLDCEKLNQLLFLLKNLHQLKQFECDSSWKRNTSTSSTNTVPCEESLCAIAKQQRLDTDDRYGDSTSADGCGWGGFECVYALSPHTHTSTQRIGFLVTTTAHLNHEAMEKDWIWNIEPRTPTISWTNLGQKSILHHLPSGLLPWVLVTNSPSRHGTHESTSQFGDLFSLLFPAQYSTTKQWTDVMELSFIVWRWRWFVFWWFITGRFYAFAFSSWISQSAWYQLSRVVSVSLFIAWRFRKSSTLRHSWNTSGHRRHSTVCLPGNERINKVQVGVGDEIMYVGDIET